MVACSSMLWSCLIKLHGKGISFLWEGGLLSYSNKHKYKLVYPPSVPSIPSFLPSFLPLLLPLSFLPLSSYLMHFFALIHIILQHTTVSFDKLQLCVSRKNVETCKRQQKQSREMKEMQLLDYIGICFSVGINLAVQVN
jgi:hypothetical protein